MKFQFTLVIFFFLTLSYSQNTESNADSLSIVEVIVTHSKIPVAARDIAKPLLIISKEAISRSAGSDLTQVLNDASGIEVVGSLSNLGKDKSVFLRGASGEYTVILINGQPILDPSGLGGVADLRSIPLANIQRIEILKGSQSTIYGSDALAGVINIITYEDQKEDNINIGAKLSTGSFNTQRGNVYINGRKNKTDFNIGLNRVQSDGISEAVSQDPNVIFEKDGMNRIGLSAGLGYQVSGQLKFRAFGRYSDYESDTDSDSFSDSETNRYLTKLLNVGSSLEYNNDSWNGAIKYTLTSTDREFLSDFGDFPFLGRFHNVDTYLSQKINESSSWIVGFNYQNHGMEEESTTIIDPSVSILSPYASLLLHLGDKTNSELGLRYNNHSTFGSNVNYSIAFSYWITNDIKAFANHSTGFKAPNLFQLYGSFGGNAELEPQKSASYEIGLQAPSTNTFLNPQITFFKRKVNDLIAYSNFVYSNVFSQDDQGVELELGIELIKNLTFRAMYTFLDGTFKELNTSLSSNALYRRPKHNISMKAFYNVNENLHFNLGIKRVGARSDLFFNPDNGFTSEEVSLGSYFYATLYVDYSFNQHFNVFFDLKNVSNSDFQEVYGFSTPGINFMAGLNWKL